MIKKTKIESGLYFDSVKLMIVTQKLKNLDGIIEAAVVMGTDLNKETLERVNLLTSESSASTPNDLVIAVEAESDEIAEQAFVTVEEILNTHTKNDESAKSRPYSLESALKITPDSNMAIISVPGIYAKYEAMEALKSGLHVMLFSDNVSIEDEIELKDFSTSNDLIVMGPDCGTAVINQTPLAFANKVRKGNIGIIAAAGTGLQEIMTLIHNEGFGISQAIGTGGRDLTEAVGGRTMLQALDALNSDSETEVIVLVSKPPAKAVEQKIFKFIEENVNKRIVVTFVGAERPACELDNVVTENFLEDGAMSAIEILSGEKRKKLTDFSALDVIAKEIKANLNPKRKFIRGLYSGGTLNYEAIFILHQNYCNVYSNTKAFPDFKLKDSYNLVENTCIDLGEDEFTVGRPHPMIDPSLRTLFFEEQLRQEDVAVVLIDIVLGYGAHAEPAKQIIDALSKADKDCPAVIASICGTYDDPQDYLKVQSQLESAGIYVMPSNKAASVLAGKVISQ